MGVAVDRRPDIGRQLIRSLWRHRSPDEATAFLEEMIGDKLDRPIEAQVSAEYAQLLEEDGRTKEAIEQLETAIDAYSRDPGLNAELGLLYARTDRLGKAAGYLRAAYDGGDRRNELLAYYGRALWEDEERRSFAISLLESAHEADPELAAPLAPLAERSFQRRDYEKAAELGRRAVASEPENAKALFNLARATFALDSREEAEDALLKLADLDGNETTGILQGLFLRDALGFIDEEDRFILKVLRTTPQAAEALTMRGEMLMRESETFQAEQLFREALRVRPGYTPARVALGQLLYMAGNVREAREELRQAAEADPRDFDLQMVLGRIELSEGDAAAAERAIRLAMDIDPSDTRGYAALGDIFIATGRLEKAIEAIEQANNNTLGRKPFAADLAAALSYRGEYEKAEAVLRDALETDESDANASWRLGYLLLLQDRLFEAEQALRKGLGEDPESTRLLSLLGEVLYRDGRLGEAERAYEQARTLASNPAAREAYDQELTDLRGLQRGALDDIRRFATGGVEPTAGTVDRFFAVGDYAMSAKKEHYAAYLIFRKGLDFYEANPAERPDDEEFETLRYNMACAIGRVLKSGPVSIARPGSDAERAEMVADALRLLEDVFGERQRELRGSATTPSGFWRTAWHYRHDPDLDAFRGDGIDELPTDSQAGFRRLWSRWDSFTSRAPLSAPRPDSDAEAAEPAEEEGDLIL